MGLFHKKQARETRSDGWHFVTRCTRRRVEDSGLPGKAFVLEGLLLGCHLWTRLRYRSECDPRKAKTRPSTTKAK